MSNKSLKSEAYTNNGFNKSFNDINNNQVRKKENNNAETVELEEVTESRKNVTLENFVYQEGGFGWIVGVCVS